MNDCTDVCKEKGFVCPVKECRHWIEYEDDHNCTLIAVEKHGQMTLREVAERLGVSFVRVKQIETKAQQKLNKRIKNRS
mgnify:FL=1|tara:strand:- start:237 stop:473 length:237 start_codon:yes stop_codon:yes gene_type:complete